MNICLPLSITQGIASYDNFVGSVYGQEVVNSQLDGFGYVRAADAHDIAKWMTEKSVKDYETMIPVKFYAGIFGVESGGRSISNWTISSGLHTGLWRCAIGS